MATISLCMIVKNEEAVLERCLGTVADLVDEIIIVDTGSTDDTKKIAAGFTGRVYDFPWCDDFAAARNYSFSLAEMDYAMWLDADDVLLESDRELFRELKTTLPPTVAAVMMKYNTGFDEQGNVTFSYYRERWIKTGQGMAWKGAVHEVVETHGQLFYSDCAVTHRKLHPGDPDRNLRIFEKLLAEQGSLEPRHQFYYGRELYYHGRYGEAASVLEAFLEEGRGWIENNIDACCQIAYCMYGLGEEEKALQWLFRCFCYDKPRAEACCDIGKHFLDRERFQQAVYWYEVALTCKREDNRGGFVSPDCYGYVPCIQLCVCFSRLGDLGKAERFNELAALCKPDAEPVGLNRQFFSLQKEQSAEK